MIDFIVSFIAKLEKKEIFMFLGIQKSTLRAKNYLKFLNIAYLEKGRQLRADSRSSWRPLSQGSSGRETMSTRATKNSSRQHLLSTAMSLQKNNCSDHRDIWISTRILNIYVLDIYAAGNETIAKCKKSSNIKWISIVIKHKQFKMVKLNQYLF